MGVALDVRVLAAVVVVVVVVPLGVYLVGGSLPEYTFFITEQPNSN